ncbi:MAG: sulfatase-like hydrolase/transferase, partial [Bryobacteraceae bacterium]
GPVPVILISVDTLRADCLSSYSRRARSTPNIDSLTKGGTLFSQASALVPLTLPSHTSLLTSTYPFSNGVEDNGQLVPPSLVTLPGILKSRGYKTAAFVGGFVLDRRFGLTQGFDVYDSPFALSAQDESDAVDLKRLGEDVAHNASNWIDKNAGGPFFVFLHLFDLHTPDNLPKAVRARFPGPRYTAELSYVDEVIGKFLGDLRKRGVLDKALIVFLSDHGESLGEHGENTHGYFIYQSTTSVPLIFHWPAGSPAAPPRVDVPVSLVSVAPSILRFLSIPAPSSFQGSVLPGLGSGVDSSEPQTVYSESLYAHHHFDTSALTSVRVGKYKYIQAPKPELYDLAADPGERNNLYASQRPLAVEYHKKLNSLRARFRPLSPRPADTISPEVVARLRSLGYLAASKPGGGSSDSGPDPKDRIADYTKYRKALTLATAGALAESNAALEGVLSSNPNLLEVRNMLALNQQRSGDHESAAKNFRRVVQSDPRNAAAHLYLAMSYSRLNNLSEALREAQAALTIASGAGTALKHIAIPATETLGAIRIRNAEYDKAREEYTSLLKMAPGNYEAHYNLAWLDSREGHAENALAHLQSAVQSKPDSPVAQNALGSIYLQRRDLEHAGKAFAEAVRLDPQFVFAHYNLGLVLGLQGAKDAAAEKFRTALKIDPHFEAARAALTRMGLN